MGGDLKKVVLLLIFSLNHGELGTLKKHTYTRTKCTRAGFWDVDPSSRRTHLNNHHASACRSRWGMREKTSTCGTHLATCTFRMWQWAKNRYPTWNPGKWKHGLKPAVPWWSWWFNFDPYPCCSSMSPCHPPPPPPGDPSARPPDPSIDPSVAACSASSQCHLARDQISISTSSRLQRGKKSAQAPRWLKRSCNETNRIWCLLLQRTSCAKTNRIWLSMVLHSLHISS